MKPRFAPQIFAVCAAPVILAAMAAPGIAAQNTAATPSWVWPVLLVLAFCVAGLFAALIPTLRAKRELLQSEAELTSIFDNSQVGIIFLKNGRSIYRANRRAAEIFGFDAPEELVGHNVNEFHANREGLELERKLGLALVSGERVTAEYQLRKKNQETAWVILSGKAVDEARPPDLNKGVLWMVTDITDRRQAEEQLALSERNFKAIVESANEAILIVQDGRIVFFNERLQEISGYSKQEITGHAITEFIHPDDMEMVVANYKKRLAGEDFEENYDFRIISRDGSTTWMMLAATLLEWEKRPATLNLLSDITERKKTEEALIQAEQRYREIFETAPVAIFRATPQGRFITVNPEYARIAGYDSADEMIREISDIALQLYLDPAERDEYKRLLNENGFVTNFEVKLKRKDGKQFWASMNTRVKKDQAGNLVSYNGFLTDITEKKRIEEAVRLAHDQLERQVESRTRELSEANAQLVELDRQKSSFLSSASHELRTPLTSILGFSRLVDRTFKRHFQPLCAGDRNRLRKAESITENLAIIEKEGERLTRLINDLLDLNKIEDGAVNWRDELLDVPRLIRTAAQCSELLFHSDKNLQLRVDTPESLPSVRADHDRILQVLTNLLDNAAKFTPQGTVVIQASKNDSGVEIRVTDSGSGVAPEDRDNIFDRYYQSQRSMDGGDKPRGTGLGLAICRQIIEHYGGTIHVEDNPHGHGASFVVRLPEAN